MTTLTPELLHKIDAYWRAANFLSAWRNSPEIRNWKWGAINADKPA
jgi:hypothetical protein